MLYMLWIITVNSIDWLIGWFIHIYMFSEWLIDWLTSVSSTARCTRDCSCEQKYKERILLVNMNQWD